MSRFYRFMKIFQSNLIEDLPKNIISDPVKIEIFKGPKTYKIPKMMGSIFTIEGENEVLLGKEDSLELEENCSYIVLTARTKNNNSQIAENECKEELDRIITILSLILTPDIFNRLIYAGWLSGEKFVVGGWVKFANKVLLEEKLLNDNLRTMKNRQKLNIDLLKRFKLMARFYSKSLLLDHISEERYLWLWTILEIFPMQNTSNIKSISEYLSDIIKTDATFLKEKLSIGKLFEMRSNLVHDGKLIKEDLEPEIFFKISSELFQKLEGIVTEVLRSMCGLEYSGALDQFLK